MSKSRSIKCYLKINKTKQNKNPKILPLYFTETYLLSCRTTKRHSRSRVQCIFLLVAKIHFYPSEWEGMFPCTFWYRTGAWLLFEHMCWMTAQSNYSVQLGGVLLDAASHDSIVHWETSFLMWTMTLRSEDLWL